MAITNAQNVDCSKQIENFMLNFDKILKTFLCVVKLHNEAVMPFRKMKSAEN